MANHSRRAVLTGFGVLSPIGVSPAGFWDSLLAGRSGVRPVTLFDASGLPCRIAGELSDFNAKTLIEKTYRKSLNAMSRMVQLGVVASQLAMQDAGLKKGDLPPERFGVDFGAVRGATEIEDFPSAARHAATAEPRVIDMEAWGARSLPDITP